MKLPLPSNSISSLIDKSYELENTTKGRLHLGASLLGGPCDRWLWLTFRWAVFEEFQGRILRLFERGQDEEARIVGWLKRIGIEITNTGKDQKSVWFGSFVSGSVDGIIEKGVPEAPKKRHVAEFKTHSLKSFNELCSKGVKDAKFQHWVQMQIYMKGVEIDRALYVAVCKDDDRVYTERVRYDEEAAQKYVDRGKRITMSERIPPPLRTDPSWFECKYCAAHSFCHKTQITREINCRTCALSTPTEDSRWLCARYGNVEIPNDAQRVGCSGHVLHPDMVPWKIHNSADPFTAVYEIDGNMVMNGEPDGKVVGSQEIIDWTWQTKDESFGPFEEVEEGCHSGSTNSEPLTHSTPGSNKGTGETHV